ncbi:MAG: metallophosphoesterase [Planctomycetota bacterium]|nr:metallophosphoesterase [Planctomycetota bacterium]MDA0969422.1 metallophosphoesterase [Planctomycetota bacterium]
MARSRRMTVSLTLASLVAMVSMAVADTPVADWVFVPDYQLGGQAANHPGPRVPNPRGEHPLVELEPAAVLFAGAEPTERLTNLLPAASIPREAFSYELWLNHHVNRPVAALICVRGREPGAAVPLTLGFHNWESFCVMQGTDGAELQLKSRVKEYGGFKQRWLHIVLTYDGHHARLYVNGDEMASGHMHHDEIAWPDRAELELAAYMQNEPAMQWANLVHAARIHDTALAPATITARFNQLTTRVHEGRLYPDLFHFTAGPSLNLTTEHELNLTWETDRPAAGLLEWGPTAELGSSLHLDAASRVHHATIAGLTPATSYFYRVTAKAEGDAIDSGILTFKTAVAPGEPFRFAVIGDTEARPHINDRLAKQIWAERPNFAINLGDLTDAGEEPHRYEWTHEYFVGMTQLLSRVPVFAVPGNGESDLHWYKHYHHLPEPGGYYTFRFGDAAFFMLDSNRREEEFAPGGAQYAWLDAQLAACDARWKFVCHHHATYTGEENDYGDSWQGPSQFGDPFVRAIVPLYEKHGVDMAMFGHLHLYERSHPIRDGKVDTDNGTVHLLAGGGGGNLEDFAPTPAFFSAKTYPDHHYVMIEILGNTLTMRMHGIDGAIRDSFVIEKGLRDNALRVSREPTTP